MAGARGPPASTTATRPTRDARGRGRSESTGTTRQICGRGSRSGAAARYGSRGSKPPRSCPTTNAETPGEHGWRIQVAQSLNGHGCRGAAVPGFRTSLATKEPVHTGTICNSGTVCQAQGIDRRMGDYFTVAVDAQGRLVAGLLGHAARRCRGPACVLPAGGRSQLRPQHLVAVGVSRDSRGHPYGGRAASGRFR